MRQLKFFLRNKKKKSKDYVHLSSVLITKLSFRNLLFTSFIIEITKKIINI